MPRTLDPDQLQSAVKAAHGRLSQLRNKHPGLAAYLVLAIPGKQTAIDSRPPEILSNLPEMIVDDEAKAKFRGFLSKPPDKDASKAELEEAERTLKRLARDLKYDGGVFIEIRFRNLDYELVAKLQEDELVDRNLTPRSRASILIVLGILEDFLA